MKKVKLVFLLGVILSLSACKTLTPTYEKQEFYSIYNISGLENNSKNYSKLSNAVKSAMQGVMDGVSVRNKIPPSELPEEPARFNNSIEKFGPISRNILTCQDSIMTATSHDDFVGQEKTTFFSCLMPYKDGVSLNIYYTFSKQSGGISNLGTDLMRGMIGDSSQFLPRTLKRIEDEIKLTGAEIKLIDSYPTH